MDAYFGSFFVFLGENESNFFFSNGTNRVTVSLLLQLHSVLQP